MLHERIWNVWDWGNASQLNELWEEKLTDTKSLFIALCAINLK